MTSKDTSKPSTTIEARVDRVLERIVDNYDAGVCLNRQGYTLSDAKYTLLKAFEAEKLKGQISELERLYMIARRGDHYSQAIQERTKSLQQQLEELPF